MVSPDGGSPTRAATKFQDESSSTRMPAVPHKPDHVTLPPSRVSERLSAVQDVKLPHAKNSERMKAVGHVTLPHHDAPRNVKLPDPGRTSTRLAAVTASHVAHLSGTSSAHRRKANPAANAALAFTLLCAGGLAVLAVIGNFGEKAQTYKVPMFAVVGLAVLLAVAAVIATRGRARSGQAQAWLSLIVALGLVAATAVMVFAG